MYKSYLLNSLILITSMSVSGCAVTGHSYKKYTNGLELSEEARKIVLVKTNVEGVSSEDLTKPDAVIIASASASRDVQVATAQALIYKSDLLCEKYMGAVLGGSKGISSLFGLTALGLTTASGLSSGSAASDLGALATTSLGVEPLLKKSVLGDQDATLIYDAVIVLRTKERAKLLTLLEDEKISPGYVLAEIGNYHSMCGVTNGVNSLRDALEARKITAETDGKKEAKKLVE